MHTLYIRPDGIETGDVEQIAAWRRRTDGFLWVDMPSCDTDALIRLFDVHPLAAQDCVDGSRVPKVRTYADHLFVVLHAPEPAELDYFIGVNHLITVNGDTSAVRARVLDGRLRPRSTAELTHAVASTMAARQEEVLSRLARDVADLEQRVMSNEIRDAEAALEEMFRLRHELLTVRTMAAEDREVLARMAALTRFLPPESSVYVEDLVDRFDRVRSLADGEKDFLQGVIDFQQSRTTTQMNIAMERLALIAAVVLPINALAGIYGMNLIVNAETRPVQIAIVLALMVAVSAAMLAWAKRHGWW